jgi:hypothetical protein
MQVGRIFTAISISSGSSSRQFSTRYTFHAGRNLPGKGLRYLRTLRVRAVVHWSLRHSLDIISAATIDLPVPDRHQLLYVSYKDLQEPMFLLNSRLKNFCCDLVNEVEHIEKLTLSFFAEFLEPPLPVRLGLLDLFTCVGCRYGLLTYSFMYFSRKRNQLNFPPYGRLYSYLSCDWHLNPHIGGLSNQTSSYIK